MGFLLGKRAGKCVAGIESFSHRILKINLSGNPMCTVIVAYSPHSGADEEDIKNFYEDVNIAIDTVPAHNTLFVVGDFNAQFGKEVSKNAFHEGTSRNGEYLLSLAMERKLVITNIKYEKKVGKKWTWISPTGMKYQSDYILVRSKWINSVKNVEAYNSFGNVGSDHRIVSANIRLSLRANSKTPPRKSRINWNLLVHNKDLQDLYTVEVKNRYSVLADNVETPTDKYEAFIKANKEVSEKLLPSIKKGKHNLISGDPRVIAARESVKNSYNEYVKDPQEDKYMNLVGAKDDMAALYNLVTTEILEGKIHDLERAHENNKHGKSWKIINDITGRINNQQGKIRGSTQKERIDSWYNHFKNLLGFQPTENHYEVEQILPQGIIHTGRFTRKEYTTAIKELKIGKSCGPDDIPPEILKFCSFDDIILDFCNEAILNGSKPEQWSILDMIPVPKHGDLGDTNNYRGISLSSIVAKTYNRMIMNRIRPAIDKELRVNQNGFRSGRTTTAHILALRRLIEGIKKKNLPAIMTFIDFKKAFDSVNRSIMFKILYAYGIPDELVNAISDMYRGTKAKVVSPDGITDYFELHAGVLQGDTLAPYLFVIVLDYVLRKAISGYEEELGFTLTKRLSKRHGPEMVTDLDFADDIVLISEVLTQAQELLGRVESVAESVGLHCNVKKTKVMTFNHEQINITAKNGEQIEVVKDFKYLGSYTASTEKDLKVRKAQAWKALNKLHNIWKSNVHRKIKLKVFCALVESILLYGCESWTLDVKLTKQLDGCYTRMLRTVLNIRWQDHVTNDVLYEDMQKLSEKVRQRRLRLAGHCYRHRDEEIAGKLLFWEPSMGYTLRGRPPINYVNQLESDTELEASEIKTCMEDRKIWKRLIIAPETHPT